MSLGQAARWMVRYEGIGSLWKGTTASLIRVAPGTGLYFAHLNVLSTAYRSGRNLERPLSPLETGCIGFLSRASVALLSCPVSVVKTRLEYQSSSEKLYHGTWDAFLKIFRYEHPRAFWTGLWPTVMRDAPFSMLYIGCYAWLRRQLAAGTGPWALSAAASPGSPWRADMIVLSALSGLLAGALATVLTQPADVIRTRIQLCELRPWEGHGVVPTRVPLSTGAAVREIWMEDGPLGFFRGTLPRLLKRSLSGAVTWTLYEFLVQSFDLKPQILS